MAGFNPLPFKFLRQKAQNTPGINPSVQSTQPVVLKPSVPSQSKPKSLSDLEKEMEARYYATYPHNPKKRGVLKTTIGRLILIGIPVGLAVGLVYIANLPYPAIRRPVAQNAPILLLPSYMKMEENYRQAIASVEQAEQLIEQPTSPADLDLGEQKVKEAQQHLNALPVWFLNDWPEYRYLGYGWRFSVYEFNTSRSQVGQLEAKVFQEKNAQTLLTETEQALNTTKQQYQQAATPTDKQMAIASWRSAIDQLEQIPGQTLAGKTAQAKLDNYKRDFQEVVGLAAGNERTSTLISAAQQFSWQAAKAAQNPPHRVTEWEQVETLWKEAIARLEKIPQDDLTGYAQAQQLLAQYKTNLGQIEIRRQAEQASVSALERAKRQIEALLASTSTNATTLDRNRVISQLQGIINELKKIQNGTTAYLEAQQLLLSAQNKLNQLQTP